MAAIVYCAYARFKGRDFGWKGTYEGEKMQRKDVSERKVVDSCFLVVLAYQ